LKRGYAVIEVVIFDLDGLLIDSQPLHFKTYNQVFSEYGYPISRDDWQLIVTQSYSIRRWIEEHKLPLDPEFIRNRKKEIYEFTIKEFKEAIQSLNKVEMQVVSNNYLLPGKYTGKILKLSEKIGNGQLDSALQVECLKLYMAKTPELMANMILDVKDELFC
jgi:hypothetical protein